MSGQSEFEKSLRCSKRGKNTRANIVIRSCSDFRWLTCISDTPIISKLKQKNRGKLQAINKTFKLQFKFVWSTNLLKAQFCHILMARTLVQKLNRTQKLNFSFPFLPSQVSATAELTSFRYKPRWSSKASFRFTSLRRQPYLVLHSKIPKYICSEMRKKMCTLDCKLKFLHSAFHPFKTRDFLMKANKT